MNASTTVYWTGDVAGHLYLNGYGKLLSTVKVSGNLSLYTDVAEQAIMANNITVAAASWSLHSVKSTGFIDYVYADVAMGPVTAGGYIGVVSRGLYPDLRGLSAEGLSSLKWDSIIQAGGWIGSVEVGGTSNGDIIAGGSIGNIAVGAAC